MDVVTLKDNTVEIIGNHNDLVNIVDNALGREVAALVAELDPATLKGVYDGYDKLFNYFWNVFKPLHEQGKGLDVEQTKSLFEEMDKCLDMIGEAL